MNEGGATNEEWSTNVIFLHFQSHFKELTEFEGMSNRKLGLGRHYTYSTSAL